MVGLWTVLAKGQPNLGVSYGTDPQVCMLANGG